jgi:hypothetical protein
LAGACGGGGLKIRLHIDRLILDGLPLASHQGPLLKSAMETELARLLARGGVSPALQSAGAVSQMPAGTMQVNRESGPTVLGKQLARVVYGRLNPGAR